ncbi:hypothetical protein ACIQGO_38445 [Streptomyces shenzhenensis]|uniref:hypothetical protein n=1 Tax=Streptomyces shenzhenensis TaxID=943815 RepID=UPI0038086848
MRAFNFKHGKAAWDSGTLLHRYVEVDWDDPRHDALAQLVTDSNQSLMDAGFPVTPVEHRWLRITIDQISKPAHLIGQVERDKLVAEVSHRVATMVGSPSVKPRRGAQLSLLRRPRRPPFSLPGGAGSERRDRALPSLASTLWVGADHG